MAQIIAYLRVSTDEQAASGLGLEAQRAAIEKAVGTPDAVFSDEGISGSNPKRPGLLGALEALRRGDTLVVAKRDRLARDTFLALWIEKEVQKRQARIVSAAGEGTESDDPAAVLMRTMVDAFATYERQLIGARTAAAMQAKKQRGEYCGGDVPFGYRLDADGETLTADPDEQRVLSIIRELRGEGESLRAISRHLAAQGFTNRKGTAWHSQSIKRLVDRAA